MIKIKRLQNDSLQIVSILRLALSPPDFCKEKTQLQNLFFLFVSQKGDEVGRQSGGKVVTFFSFFTPTANMSEVAKSNTTLYLNIIGTAGRGAAPVSRKQPTRGRAAREELITVSASHLIIIVRSSPPRREIREPPWCFCFFSLCATANMASSGRVEGGKKALG